MHESHWVSIHDIVCHIQLTVRWIELKSTRGLFCIHDSNYVKYALSSGLRITKMNFKAFFRLTRKLKVTATFQFNKGNERLWNNLLSMHNMHVMIISIVHWIVFKKIHTIQFPWHLFYKCSGSIYAFNYHFCCSLDLWIGCNGFRRKNFVTYVNSTYSTLFSIAFVSPMPINWCSPNYFITHLRGNISP